MVSSSTPVKPRISTYGWASPQWPNCQNASPKSPHNGGTALLRKLPLWLSTNPLLLSPISPPPVTYKPSKNCWPTSSAFQNALVNPNPSSTISWASQLRMERSGYGAITSTKSPFQKLATPTPSKILLQQKNLKERNLSEVTRRYDLLKSVLALSSQQFSILSRVSEGRSNMRTRNSRARTRYVLRSEWARPADILSAQPRAKIEKERKRSWGSEREKGNEHERDELSDVVLVAWFFLGSSSCHGSTTIWDETASYEAAFAAISHFLSDLVEAAAIVNKIYAFKRARLIYYRERDGQRIKEEEAIWWQRLSGLWLMHSLRIYHSLG